jgi:nitroimidazol reductase NimA-like FMN-containing flavoprotein (pyridoxamine 5'-phosphate oxidase superfamily)
MKKTISLQRYSMNDAIFYAMLSRGRRGGEGDDTMLEKMKEMVRFQKMCVLATVSGGQPHCSLMSYAVDDDCREIYLLTFKNTKKYKNMNNNPAVSLLIDTREEDHGEMRRHAKALTANGVFVEVTDPARRDMIKARLLARHPQLHILAENPDAEYFAVRIKSLQLLEGVSEASFATLE